MAAFQVSIYGRFWVSTEALIEQLVEQSQALTAKELAKLSQITVVRRGGRPHVGVRRRGKPRVSHLGNRTWLVGIREMVCEASPAEARMIARAVETVRSKQDAPDFEPAWVYWGTRSRCARECRAGDSLIRIWRSNKAKRPSCVLPAAPVLLKQRTTKWIRFYLGEPTGSDEELSWGRFQRLMKQLGYAKRIRPGSVLPLDADVADAIGRAWRRASKA